MPIALTTLTSTATTLNQSSYVTTSFSGDSNQLILGTILNTSTASGSMKTPTLSSTNGLTWVQIETVGFNTTAAPVRRLTTFRTLFTSAPTAGAVTIDFAGTAQSGCGWDFAEFSNVLTSGTNGSGAIVQSTFQAQDATSTSITVTLAAFASTNNATYGGFHINTQEAQTAGAGFTAITDTGFATPTVELFTEWLNGQDTTVDESSVTLIRRAGIALEIAGIAPSGGVISSGGAVLNTNPRGVLLGRFA